MAAIQDEMEQVRKERDDEIDRIIGEYESKLKQTEDEIRTECNQEKEVCMCALDVYFVL